MSAAIHLVAAGENADERLVADRARELVEQCLGGGDRTLMLEEFDGAEYTLAAVVDAAQTLPFLTDRRVVVARGIGRFAGEDAADDVAVLVAYLRSPSDTSDVVLVGGGGRTPKAITDAVKAVGTVHAVGGPRTAKDKQAFADAAIRADGLALTPGAISMVVQHLGEDLPAIGSLLATLRATYGADRRLSESDVAPYLGDAGSVPPWELTDAIDAGNVPRALDTLARTLTTRHPLVVMATLLGHYQRVLRLDGAGAQNNEAAATHLGLDPRKSAFQAGKALDTARRLGHEGVERAFALLAEADSDLRGGTGWPETVVLEVLVARLARLVRPAPASAAGRPSGRGGVRPR